MATNRDGLVEAITAVMTASSSSEPTQVEREIATEPLGFAPALLGTNEVPAVTFAQT